MATSTLNSATNNSASTVKNSNKEVGRHEIQAAIAKAVELRAIHAALMQGSSPSNHRGFPSSSPSPVSRHVPQFSAQDYPVFTPSYEDEPFTSHHQMIPQSRTLSETWDEYGLGGGSPFEPALSDYNKDGTSSKKGIASGLHNLDPHMCSVLAAEDQKSVTGSCANNVTVLRSSPGSDLFKSSRRNSLTDSKSVSSCNRCKPAMITSESASMARNSRYSNIVVPLTDSHSSAQSQPKNRGVISWLFPKLKKKHKNEQSPRRNESEEVSQILKDLGIMSVETLKRELMEANENKDAALMEVARMKSSMGEFRQKLEYLESYCEELKKALKLATQSENSQAVKKLGMRVKSADVKGENSMPVTEEVMVEGFLQIVSEARLSVKHFCKTLVGQVDETDVTLIDNLNLLLQPYKLSLNSKYSKAVLYHLEAIINQSLYQDFENLVFQKNGSPKLLDPHQNRQAQFSSFVALRNLSWNEVLRKGTKFYSEEFSKFCDQKMSCIITTLNWTRPWPEQLLQAFFVAAKCIWLLHLLAFSFNPALAILRVDENRSYDPQYMEDIFLEKQRSSGSSRVKVMIMPGFYVQDKVLRCKVLCRYRSVA